MKEANLINIALENLFNATGLRGKWKGNGIKELDGKLEFVIGNKHPVFNLEVKKEFRNHHLPIIMEHVKKWDPLMLVAEKIFPKIKEELRKQKIAYLETNGNIYLNADEQFVWLEGNKALTTQGEKVNRAFTKTGAKVIFLFLLEENFINLPYRDLAEKADVALGNINYIMNGLKEMGFILKINKEEVKLTNKKELLEKWMAAYEEKLKPHLYVDTFRFLKEEDFLNWKKLPLKHGETYWGGEPAGDLLTNYLRPAMFTLYTNETRADLMKNYKLVPDKAGNIKVYKKFWELKEIDKANHVPPLLVYADLMNTGDPRNIETAQKIYERFLQNKY
ncbi:MAG: hypothetical protein HYU69_02865 [Bacteroidetes bacterium]|nr:hypothetical protein [Bacteroidota bacterium]